MSSIETLARYVSDLRLDQLPSHVLNEYKGQVLDAIVTGIAGWRVPAGRIAALTAAQLGGHGNATTLVLGQRVSASHAAFANAQMSTALDLGANLYFSQGLPGVTLFPALALAEELNGSGRQVLEAFVAGYEVAGRIGLSFPSRWTVSADGQRMVGLGRPQSRWIAFGAAAAVAKVLRLTHPQVAHALALAGSSAPVPASVRFLDGSGITMSKGGLDGLMAFSAIAAGRLAANGFTADTSLLEGVNGFHAAMGAESQNIGELTRELGTRWVVLDGNYKRFPSGTHNQKALHAFEQLVAKHVIQPEEIEAVDIGRAVGTSRAFTNPAPKNYVEAELSLPFAISAIAFGLPPREWHSAIDVPHIQSLSARVKLVEDAEAIAVFRQEGESSKTRSPWFFDSRVRVRTTRGTYEALSNYGRVTKNELADKCRHYCETLLPESAIEELIETVAELENVTRIGDLTRLLVGREDKTRTSPSF